LPCTLANDFSPVASNCVFDRKAKFWQSQTQELGLTLPQCPGGNQGRSFRNRAKQWANSTASGNLILELVTDFRMNNGLLKESDELTEIVGSHEQISLRRMRGFTEDLAENGNFIEAAHKDFEKMAVAWKNKSRQENFNLVWLIVPSKQLVLTEFATAQGVGLAPSPYSGAVKAEKMTAEWLVTLAHDNAIHVVDALPYVIAAKEALAGRPLYNIADGHPMAEGYNAYATAVIEAVTALDKTSATR
jgi:hypothetical protein